MNTGWICSKCSRSYAPFVQECNACNTEIAAPLPWRPLGPYEVAPQSPWPGYPRPYVGDLPPMDSPNPTITWWQPTTDEKCV